MDSGKPCCPGGNFHRKIGWAIFGSQCGNRLHRLTPLFWKRFYAWMKRREM
jgi:hypothetical protein